MNKPTNQQIEHVLINIMSDGFNRSLGALTEAGGIKQTKKMSEGYRGVGTELYDLVTEQLQYTAKFGANTILNLFEEQQDD